MAESLQKRTIKGMVWTSFDSFSKFGIRFIISLILARILSPTEFGQIGMLTVFITVSQSIIVSGFSQALVRKKNRTQTDCSTVFYFNIVVSFIMYGIIYFCAPAIARFYEMPHLCQLLRVLAIVLIIDSFCVVQRALYTAAIDFKTIAKVALSASVVAGITSLSLAWMGFGVWALVLQQIVFSICSLILLWTFSKWRPTWTYSWKSFRELFAFGSNLLISGLIDTIYKNMYPLVIGKMFTAASLGQYTRASYFANLPSHNLTLVLQRVSYPVMCDIQYEDARLRKNYRLLIRMSSFVIFPSMCLLAGIAIPLIEILIGAKWHYAATLLVPLCFARMWYPVHVINLNLLKVKGRTDLFLRLEIIKKIVGVMILLISIQFGLTFMCWTYIFSSIFGLFINTYYTGKLINAGFLLQMRDLAPTLLLSLGIFAIVFTEGLLIHSNIVHLVVGIASGVGIYFAAVRWMGFSEYQYLMQIIKNFKKK